MLLMQSTLYGTFTAQNFVLWFLFYEMSLFPAFLLIKLWGGENRDVAATKFFIYTFLGSVAMLLWFLGIYFATGTFDFEKLAGLGRHGLLGVDKLAWLVFAGIFLGLAVKVPLFPFHTWLPDAYDNAPVGVSMVLTGILWKLGVYGFVRLLLPLFPHEIKILGPWLWAGGLYDRFCVARRVGAIGSETDARVFVAQPSRLLYARSVRRCRAIACPDRHAGGLKRRLHPDLQPRTYRRRVVLLCRITRATARIPGLNDFGGLMQRTPLLCGWMSVAMFSSLGLPGSTDSSASS